MNDIQKILHFIEKWNFGPYTITSTTRPSDNYGYHIDGHAVDFVPDFFWINLPIYWLFWPGGMGHYDLLSNRHIHLDTGPFRRWIED
jgi:uncharacterized protein YcbK (DUF882 family)